MAQRLVVYLRKSSESDEKQAESIERQKRDIYTYIKKQALIEENEELQLTWEGVEGKDLFFEKASAKVEGRKQFEEMVKAR